MNAFLYTLFRILCLLILFAAAYFVWLKGVPGAYEPLGVAGMLVVFFGIVVWNLPTRFFRTCLMMATLLVMFALIRLHMG